MNLLNLLQSTPVPTVVGLVTLLALLGLAMWFDIRARRIPNLLVLGGLAVSLITQGWVGFDGLQSWGLGLLAGFALLLPLYLLRAMGAGDVKLLAMVGSFLGPIAAINVVLATLVVGGVLAVLIGLWKGSLGHAMRNVQLVMSQTALGGASGRAGMRPPAVSAGNMPYAVAIASGTFIHLLLSLNGLALFG